MQSQHTSEQSAEGELSQSKLASNILKGINAFGLLSAAELKEQETSSVYSIDERPRKHVSANHIKISEWTADDESYLSAEGGIYTISMERDYVFEIDSPNEFCDELEERLKQTIILVFKKDAVERSIGGGPWECALVADNRQYLDKVICPEHLKSTAAQLFTNVEIIGIPLTEKMLACPTGIPLLVRNKLIISKDAKSELTELIKIAYKDQSKNWLKILESSDGDRHFLHAYFNLKLPHGVSLLMPDYLKAINLLASTSSDDFALHLVRLPTKTDLKKQSKILSAEKFKNAIQHYMAYKDKFFLRWLSSSEESLQTAMRIKNADSDKERFKIAKKYVKMHPEKQLSKNLAGCIPALRF